MTGSFGKTD
jgi:hypothetical protein